MGYGSTKMSTVPTKTKLVIYSMHPNVNPNLYDFLWQNTKDNLKNSHGCGLKVQNTIGQKRLPWKWGYEDRIYIFRRTMPLSAWPFVTCCFLHNMTSGRGSASPPTNTTVGNSHTPEEWHQNKRLKEEAERHLLDKFQDPSILHPEKSK